MPGMSPRMKAKKGRFGPGGLVPTIKILSPNDGDSFAYNTPITFTGEAYDDLNGDVSSQIVWTNDYNGSTQTGASVQFGFSAIGSPSTPSTITVTATYSDGTNTVTDTVTITVS